MPKVPQNFRKTPNKFSSKKHIKATSALQIQTTNKNQKNYINKQFK